MSITTVGIIGAGTMGNGIAPACAVSGIQVIMVDISEAAVGKGLSTVAGSLGTSRRSGSPRFANR